MLFIPLHFISTDGTNSFLTFSTDTSFDAHIIANRQLALEISLNTKTHHITHCAGSFGVTLVATSLSFEEKMLALLHYLESTLSFFLYQQEQHNTTHPLPTMAPLKIDPKLLEAALLAPQEASSSTTLMRSIDAYLDGSSDALPNFNFLSTTQQLATAIHISPSENKEHP